MSSLVAMCFFGELAKLRKAIDRGEDVNSKEGSGGRTGLMLAVQYKHNSIVKLLLEQPKLDLNATNGCGWTALHRAVIHGNVEALKLLLADSRLNSANHKSNDGWTAVMIAITSKSVNALRELIAHPSVDLDIVREGRSPSLEEYARWDFLQYFFRFHIGQQGIPVP